MPLPVCLSLPPAALTRHLLALARRAATSGLCGVVVLAFILGASAPVVAQTVTSVTLTSDVAAPQPPGTRITWTATATGGVAPVQYKWWLWDGVAWTPRAWTASRTFVWTPTGPNSAYRVAVWVKSAGNDADMSEAGISTAFPIVVDAARTLFFDTFTGADGAWLVSHAPDVNGAAGVWASLAPVMPLLHGQQLAPSEPDTNTYVNGALIAMPAADGVLGVDWTGASTNTMWGYPMGGLRVRATDADNGFVVGFGLAGPGSLALYRVVAGAWTMLGQNSVPNSAGRTARLEVVLNGPNIGVYENGVLKIQVRDSYHQAVARHGLYWVSAWDWGSTFDNLSLLTLPAPTVSQVVASATP